jgi:hypothetical protein
LEIGDWPEGMNFYYGDSDIEEKGEQFCLSGRHCVRAYRELKGSKRKSVSAHVQTLLTSVKTIPVPTAKCERSFSVMNLSLFIPHFRFIVYELYCSSN